MRSIVQQKLLLFIAVLIIGSVATTAAFVKKGDDHEEHRLIAESAAESFMTQLQGVLMKELREGGPVQALSVCADTAQLLTQSAATDLGVSIKRVSDQLRNIENTPDAFEQHILDLFSGMYEEGIEPPFIHTEERTVNGQKEFWFMQSIHVQPQCLGCHGPGDRIASNVKTLLNERYPEDKAVGYKPGDLRGAIRVSFSLTK